MTDQVQYCSLLRDQLIGELSHDVLLFSILWIVGFGLGDYEQRHSSFLKYFREPPKSVFDISFSSLLPILLIDDDH